MGATDAAFLLLLVLCLGACRSPNVPEPDRGPDPVPALSAEEPAGKLSAQGATPVLTWVDVALPSARWSATYQWLSRESAADVWNRGRPGARPLKDAPVGLRAIRPWDTYWLKRGADTRSMAASTWGYRDELVLDRGTPGERSLGYIAPWFDDWNRIARPIQEQLADDMVAAGGSVDYLIMDWENYDSHYNIRNQLATLGIRFADYVRAVTQDPRWPRLRADLNDAAREAGYTYDEVNFDDDLRDMESGWNNGHSPRAWVWARLMHIRLLESLENVLFEPWAERYPNIKASDYRKFVNGPWPTYSHAPWSVDAETAPVSFGPDTKWIVGTHQAPVGYGTRGVAPDVAMQIHRPASAKPARLPVEKWVKPTNMDERFASLLVALRALRGAAAARDAGGPPLMMWIAGDQYEKSVWVPAGGAPDYQWYSEAIFHFALHDIEAWLLWNTPRKPDGSSEQRVEHTLNEVERHISGVAGLQSITNEPPDWDSARYLLSGMRVGDREVYRFTPGESGRPIVDEATGAFRFEFERDGTVVVPVPGAKVVREDSTMSELGWWLDVVRGR